MWGITYFLEKKGKKCSQRTNFAKFDLIWVYLPLKRRNKMTQHLKICYIHSGRRG